MAGVTGMLGTAELSTLPSSCSPVLSLLALSSIHVPIFSYFYIDSANFYKDNFRDESLTHYIVTMNGINHFYCHYPTKVRNCILTRISIITFPPSEVT